MLPIIRYDNILDFFIMYLNGVTDDLYREITRKLSIRSILD